MLTRRGFCGALALSAQAAAPGYRIQLDVLRKGYDGETCWVHARAGAIPGRQPAVVLTMQKLLVAHSDIFFALNDLRSDDSGKTWVGPTEHGETLGRRVGADGQVVVICDFWPKYHRASGKLLGIGHTCHFRDNKIVADRPRETAYSVYDAAGRTWSRWEPMGMPGESRFAHAGAGCAQRVDLENGDILLPIYYRERKAETAAVMVARCRFDGKTLRFVEHGNELRMDTKRGLLEPSLARYQGNFYLTMRHDDAGYIARSRDGLTYSEPQLWRFDDGADLGNYNTQQHWVTHSDGLFLVYTRRGANNDHVFRHRAPLFMAQVDVEKLRVIRVTERVVVPERGARLGNFGVVEVNERETWVTVSEWMQTWGPNYVMPVNNKYGADNRVYAARIQWEKPNREWQKT